MEKFKNIFFMKANELLVTIEFQTIKIKLEIQKYFINFCCISEKFIVIHINT